MLSLCTHTKERLYEFTGHLQTKNEALIRNENGQSLDFELSASKLWEKKFLLVSIVFCYGSLSKLIQMLR